VRAAFFDLDKTVIAQSSVVALGPELHARGLLRRSTLIYAALAQVVFLRFGASEDRLTQVTERVLKITRGWDHDEIRALVRETMNTIVEPLIYAEARDLLARHQLAGDQTWLVSMAPAEVVEPFAELLKMTGAISSRARIDENGKFTGEMDFIAQGSNKALAMREVAAAHGIDLAESFAYSDSETDIPMLEVVGHPYAVNPDRGLSRTARDRGWPTLSFTHPVRAHDGNRSRTPFVISAFVLGALALIGRGQARRR
jgi:HAD superfamily hydrolase (TIGR01490 family)